MTNSPTILIVGGVAGGASAATRARRMNEHARIVIYEKDAYVSFANCGLPYHLGGEIADREKLLVAKPELFEKRFRIEVKVKHEVTGIDRAAKTITVKNHLTGGVSTEKYDKLILAPGASPLVPPLPGVRAKGVYTLRNVEDTDAIMAALPQAKKAVVVGGGFIGLEVAEQLRQRGLEVALVEMQAQVLPLMDREMAEPLHRELEGRGIRLVLGQGLKEIETVNDQASAVTVADGTRLATDFVLLGLGVRPNVQLAKDAGIEIGTSGGIATNDFMQTSDPDIYAVGDAAEYAYGPTRSRMRVPLAGPANKTGRLAGEHAATGRGRAAPQAWGTAIVRVFGKTAGLTGLSLKAAQKMGLDARAVHITANHHAGYFPGAEPMLLKLLYENKTGRILGAQAVGGLGVDKRLDIVATLLHQGGRVDDLAQLDLAYAPPFGSAKDPLHMAAFAAQNDLDGLVPLLAPDANLSGYQVVDVRSAGEVARLPLTNAPFAINIPLEQLRDRLDELDPRKITVASCQTGLRSHVAANILRGNGFVQVSNLSGAASVRDLIFNRETSAAPASASCASTPVSACGAQPCGQAATLPPLEGENITPADLGAHLSTGHLHLVDVRTPAEYRAQRVKGAINIPLDTVTPQTIQASRPANAAGPVCILCQGGTRAAMAAKKLKAAGIECVVVAGGTTACITAGLEMEPAAATCCTAKGGGQCGPIPLERQVFIGAGLMILAGVLLGWQVDPRFYILSGFVGCGLTFAGVTGFCPMAFVLGKCPWNK